MQRWFGSSGLVGVFLSRAVSTAIDYDKPVWVFVSLRSSDLCVLCVCVLCLVRACIGMDVEDVDMV